MTTFAADFNKSSAKMGCTSAKSELSALGLHHHCTRIRRKVSAKWFFLEYRDLAQLVAHTSGGREVAGSSPVIPTTARVKVLIFSTLTFLIPRFAQRLHNISSARPCESPLYTECTHSSETVLCNIVGRAGISTSDHHKLIQS